MATALISLGSNLGDRKATLDTAIEKLRQTAGIKQVVVSSYHATKPVGGPEGQEEFLNAAARMETSLSPRALLSELQRIERELGRVRQEHWGPRTLDLDLLLYDDRVINAPELIVPHRFLPFRRFVLEPAAEIAAGMKHPVLGWTVERMLFHARTAADQFHVVSDSLDRAEPFRQRLEAAGIKMSAEQPKAVFYFGNVGQSSLTESVPTLLLPADDLDRAVREAVAAIQAMQ
jgi:2-amino-4-hydroxy-6-hydroxymethyldihydropteridine diphosphokinase